MADPDGNASADPRAVAGGGGGDADPVDHTQDPDMLGDAGEGGGRIRLRGGIDVQQLLAQRHGAEGIMFEPEIDETLFKGPSANDRSYFSMADAELGERMERLCVDEDPEDDEDDSFDAKAARMVNVTDDGKVKKRVTFGGLTTEGPPPDKAAVTIHFSLYLENFDEPFDSSVLRGRPERFRLDDGRMIMGLELGVKTMKKRERAEFLIQYEYAFGLLGCPPRVPPKEAILAKVELLDFAEEAEAEALLAMTPEERSAKKSYADIEAVVSKEHRQGNVHFARKEYKEAIRRYRHSIMLLEDVEMKNDDEEAKQKKLLLKLYINRALCFTKIHWPKKACLDCQKALEIDNRNAKALYRMGVAKRQLGNLDDAMHYLLRAQRLAPGDTDVGAEVAGLDGLMRRQQQDERAICQRMFPGAQLPRRERDLADLVDDEMRADIYHQIKGFAESTASVLPLPGSLGEAEVAAVRKVGLEFGLGVRAVNRGHNKMYEVFKKEE